MRPRVEDGRQDGEARLGDAYLAKAPDALPRCDRVLCFDGSSLGYALKSSSIVSVLLANGTEGDVVDRAQTDVLFLAIKQPGNSVRRKVVLGPRALLAD